MTGYTASRTARRERKGFIMKYYNRRGLLLERSVYSCQKNNERLVGELLVRREESVVLRQKGRGSTIQPTAALRSSRGVHELIKLDS
jgi:hypothetical protein